MDWIIGGGIIVIIILIVVILLSDYVKRLVAVELRNRGATTIPEEKVRAKTALSAASRKGDASAPALTARGSRRQQRRTQLSRPKSFREMISEPLSMDEYDDDDEETAKEKVRLELAMKNDARPEFDEESSPYSFEEQDYKTWCSRIAKDHFSFEDKRLVKEGIDKIVDTQFAEYFAAELERAMQMLEDIEETDEERGGGESDNPSGGEPKDKGHASEQQDKVFTVELPESI